MTPSFGEACRVSRDPHLRLRRTLTPSLNVGIPKYAEAQFMLSKEETTGKRLSLEFGVPFGGATRRFAMDAYAFGASEAEANVRVVTLHGISPGVSRTRWHALGERYDVIARAASTSSPRRVRFVALDWHSIDRSVDDRANTEFLTCLPKHIWETSTNGENLEDVIRLFDSEDRREWLRKFAKDIEDGCPRKDGDGGRILRAVIEEGLGWGERDTPFILGVKSWSGGLGGEFMTPSFGEACRVSRDPHLRLRRTLTPSLNVGIPKYAEAQFMLSKEETTGKRLSLEFGVPFGGATRRFAMDAYAFGASEAEANVRVVTLHGISPGVSRTRWHALGERYDVIARAASTSSHLQ
ncbi:hypothetical protein ACHAW5_007260 [Stephanodiscus triporus]|uniref:Uncharacterized protein n=1 Tax=Stephanodiscus triporus TaxID=2934178 RepID=A0ABD3P3F6_9STRA